MTAILEIVTRILGLLAQLSTVLGFVAGQTQKAAQENVPFSIDTNVSIIKEVVTDGSFGNNALLTAITAVMSQQLADTATLTTLIADLTNGTTPVSLPVTPPTGYGSPAISDIANAVWNEPQDVLPSTPGDALLQVARSLNTTGIFDMPLYEGIFRVGRIDWPDPGFYISGIEYPTFDPTDVLIDDTLFSCLTRQNPTWILSYPWGPQTYVGLDPTGGGTAHYTTLIDEEGFQTYKAGVLGLTALQTPPVWPGIDLVTLGSDTAISSSFTVDGPMDGVIVLITDVTANKPHLDYGGQTAYKFIGSLAFVSDNGDVEEFQLLGFNDALYCPRQMARAAQVVVRADPSLVGTVTPWVID